MNDPKPGFIGKSVERREDYRFLTGNGQYTDDITLPGQTFAAFLRSPHAHARIRAIDTAAARAAPGVLAVFTGKDVAGVNGLPCGCSLWAVFCPPSSEVFFVLSELSVSFLCFSF